MGRKSHTGYCRKHFFAGRRSQLKIAETIFVLMIFFFLLVFGIGFYASYAKRSMRESAEEARDLRAIRNIQGIQYLPELQCTDSGKEDFDCIDLYKAMAFEEVFQGNKGIYQSLFGKTGIDIVRVYPPAGPPSGDGIIELYEYSDNIQSGGGTPYMVPVVLYNTTSHESDFAYLNITIYR